MLGSAPFGSTPLASSTSTSSAYRLALDVGQFAISGPPIGEAPTITMQLAIGQLAVTLVQPTTYIGAYATLDVGQVATTGTLAFYRSRRMPLSVGQVSIVGQDVVGTPIYAAQLDVGQVALKLGSPAVKIARAAALPALQYTIAGTMRVARGYSMQLAVGQFSATGTGAQLTAGYPLSLATGQLKITNPVLTLAANHNLPTTTGQFVLMPGGGTARGVHKLPLDVGQFEVFGLSPQLVRQRKVAGAQGAYSLTGRAVQGFATRSMRLATGRYLLSGSVTAARSRVARLPAQMIFVGGFPSTASLSFTMTLSLGHVGLTLSQGGASMSRVLTLAPGIVQLFTADGSAVYSGDTNNDIQGCTVVATIQLDSAIQIDDVASPRNGMLLDIGSVLLSNTGATMGREMLLDPGELIVSLAA